MTSILPETIKLASRDIFKTPTKTRLAIMIDLLLKIFFGISLAYIQSLEGSLKAG